MDLATNFEYKGDRMYVHSTTMGEFLGEHICPLIGLNAADIRLDAQFHRVVTKNGIMRCQEVPMQSRSHAEIAAEFRLVSSAKTYYAYFIEGDKPVESRIDPKYDIEDWNNPAPFTGSCRINISSTRAILENTIEANKRLHQAAFGDRPIKVINLYMKKFPLEIQGDGVLHTLNIRHIGARHHNEGLTTLNKFSFVGLDIPAFEICYFIPGVTV